MNLPNYKDVLKIVLEKLAVFRNNVPLLISVIIALIGLLLFVPTQLLSRNLQNQMQQESIAKLAEPLRNVKANPITPDQVKQVEDNFNKLSADANAIEMEAVNSTKRELLNPAIFHLDPNDPNGTVALSIFYDFGKRYCGKIDDFIKSHNARLCPTETEITTELENSGINSLTTQARRSAYDNRDQVDNMKGIMVDEICQNRAKSASIYIDPYAISGYDFWSQFSYSSWTDDIENCWYSQLGYWVIEDIFDTIAAMDKGHDSLMDAPVKRLMKITFSDTTASKAAAPVPVGVVGVNPSVTYNDRPSYVLSTDKIPKDTPTGRYSDENHDVIHFKVTFVVVSGDTMRLIRELCSAKEHEYVDKSGQTQHYKHNQISVLGMVKKSVDMKSDEHKYYRYGDENVSEVELTCEYLFNKKGYDDIKPQSVKEFLGEIAQY